MSSRKRLVLIICLNGENICVLTNLMLGKSVLFLISNLAPTIGIGNLDIKILPLYYCCGSEDCISVNVTTWLNTYLHCKLYFNLNSKPKKASYVLVWSVLASSYLI